MVGMAGSCQCGQQEPDINSPLPDNQSVPDAGQSSEEIGTIFGRVIDQEGVAVSGAEILADSGEKTLSETDGRFSLDVSPSASDLLLHLRASGFHDQHVTVNRPVNQGDRTDAGDIVMLAADALVLIEGDEYSIIESETEEFEVEIPPGTFPDGTEVRVTYLQIGANNEGVSQSFSWATGGSEAQVVGAMALSTSTGAQPANAIGVKFTTEIAFPPGLEVPFSRLDETTGGCTSSGIATALPASESLRMDRTTFSAAINHFSTFALALPVVAEPGADDPRPDDGTTATSKFPEKYPRVHPLTGALQLGIDVGGGLADNEESVLTLYYDSSTALPAATLSAAQLYEGGAPPHGAIFSASVFGQSRRVQVAPASWDQETESFRNGRYRMRFSASDLDGDWLESGPYSYSMRLGLEFKGNYATPISSCAEGLAAGGTLNIAATRPITKARVVEGVVPVSNRRASPFGAGWWLWGLSRLYDNGATVMVDEGEGAPPGIWRTIPSWQASRGFNAIVSVLPEGYVGTPTLEDYTQWFVAADDDAFLAATHSGALVRLVPGGSPQLLLGRDFNHDQAVAGNWNYTEAYVTPSVSAAEWLGGIYNIGVDHTTGDVYIEDDSAVIWRLSGNNMRAVVGTDDWSATEPISDGAPAFGRVRNESGMIVGRDGRLYFMNNGESYFLDGTTARRAHFEPQAHIGVVDKEGRFYTGRSGGCIEWTDLNGDKGILTAPCNGDRVANPTVVSEMLFRGISGIDLDADGNLWVLDSLGHPSTYTQVLWRIAPTGELTQVTGVESGQEHCDELSCQPAIGSARGRPLRAHSVAGLPSGHALLGYNVNWDLILLSPGGEELAPASNANGELVALENGGFRHNLGRGRAAVFDGEGRILSRIVRASREEKFTWQGDLLTSWQTAAGIAFSFQYTSGKLSRIDTPVGDWSFVIQNDELVRVTFPGGGTTRYQYASDLSHLLERRYDTHDNETLFEFDDDGLIKSVRMPERAPLNYVPENRLGRVDRDIDPETGEGRLPVSWQMLQGASYPNGRGADLEVRETSQGYLVIDPDEGTKKVLRDAQGRIRSTVEKDGTRIEYTYNGRGDLTRVRNQTLELVWDYVRDSSGRLVRRVDPAGNTHDLIWDSQGRLTQVENPWGGVTLSTYDANDRVTAQETVAADHTLSYAYSYDVNSGNLTSRTGPGDLQLSYAYDSAGRITTATTGENETASRAYAASGLLASTTAPGGAVRGVSNEYTGYAAFERGPPPVFTHGETDPLGRQSSFDSNGTWSKVQQTTPWGGTATWTYDEHGRVATLKNALDEVTSFEYDTRGRRQTTIWADGTTLNLSRDQNGRITSYVGPHDRIDLSYDAADRVTGFSVTPLVSGEVEATVVYDLSSPAEHAITSGGLLRRVSLREGRPLEITVDGETVWHGIYSVDGRLLEVSHGVTQQTQSYDARLSVGAVRHIYADRTDLFEYTIDRGGRTVGWSEPDGRAGMRGFDSAGRIVSDSGSGPGGIAESFSWDAATALVEKDGRSFSVDTAGRLVDDGIYSYTWDALGRRTARTLKTDATHKDSYTWNARGALAAVTVERPGAEMKTISWTYDALGRRRTRSDGLGTESYIWEGITDRLLEIVAADGSRTRLITTESGYRPLLMEKGGVIYAFHLDPNASVVGISDLQSGQSGARTRYSAFGVPERLDGEVPYAPFGFHGMFYDAELGLYFTPERVYDPEVAAFLSPDPEGTRGGHNPYTYAGGTPSVHRDPTGAGYFDNLRTKFFNSGFLGRYKRRTEALTNDFQKARKGDIEAQVERLRESPTVAAKTWAVGARSGLSAWDVITNPVKAGSSLVSTAFKAAKAVGKTVYTAYKQANKTAPEEGSSPAEEDSGVDVLDAVPEPDPISEE